MTRSAQVPSTSRTSSAFVMDLLSRHVPLLLLLDLADPYGPHSTELFEDEGPRALVRMLV
jgi:hypothetical protein